jgi:hypothetical protein
MFGILAGLVQHSLARLHQLSAPFDLHLHMANLRSLEPSHFTVAGRQNDLIEAETKVN